jgi:2-polyprenyl-6-hydroxyphenyl methylase/3-demethylubiquinone-9 3-methyltransferase
MNKQGKQRQIDPSKGSGSEIYIWDHSSHDEFYNYYAKESQSEETFRRFRTIRDCILGVIKKNELQTHSLDIADIGCGAGTQCMIWAELDHHVHGLDVNEPLLKLARERASEAGYGIDYRVGSAVDIPWADSSMDVCLVLELIEHVADWETCLHQCIRILKPGGILFLTTTNKLCPFQEEFNLPLYSWYPARLKRFFERIATTTHPELVNYAKWFHFFRLHSVLQTHGFQCFDRFDIMDLSEKDNLRKVIGSLIRAVFLCRWFAYFFAPSTTILAIKGKK